MLWFKSDRNAAPVPFKWEPAPTDEEDQYFESIRYDLIQPNKLLQQEEEEEEEEESKQDEVDELSSFDEEAYLAALLTRPTNLAAQRAEAKSISSRRLNRQDATVASDVLPINIDAEDASTSEESTPTELLQCQTCKLADQCKCEKCNCSFCI